MSSDHNSPDKTAYGRRTVLRATALAGLVGLGSGTALATPTGSSHGLQETNRRPDEPYPEVIHLPEGFQPEGIVTGKENAFYVGSVASGDIYRGDLRTGEGSVFVEADEDQVAIGLSFDERSDDLFVAGGATGQAYVYDARSGELRESYQLTDPDTFVNDVVVTREAAYFTNSFRPELYRLPLGECGDLPEQDAVETLSLGDEYESVEGFNANGIDAPLDAAYLVVVNSSTGHLYKVDPASGDATPIDLGGETVTNGDGVLLDGQTVYVVRNRDNEIAVVDLASGATEGEVVDTITDPAFDVPTTIAEFGRDLYAVNARFGIENPADATYSVVRVSK